MWVIVSLILGYIAIAILTHDPIVPRSLTVHQLLTGYNIVYTHDGKLYQNDEYVMDLRELLIDVDFETVKNCETRECSLWVLNHLSEKNISSREFAGMVDKKGQLQLYENINFNPLPWWRRSRSTRYIVDIYNKTWHIISSWVNGNDWIMSYDIIWETTIVSQRTGDIKVYANILFIDWNQIGPYRIIIKQDNWFLLQEDQSRARWTWVWSNDYLWYDFTNTGNNIQISYLSLKDSIVWKYIWWDIDSSIYTLSIKGVVDWMPIVELSTSGEKILLKWNNLLWTWDWNQIQIQNNDIYSVNSPTYEVWSVYKNIWSVYKNNILLKDNVMIHWGELVGSDICFWWSVLCKISDTYYSFIEDVLQKMPRFNNEQYYNTFIEILHFVRTDYMYLNKYGIVSKDYTLLNYKKNSLSFIEKIIYRNRLIQKTIGYQGWWFLLESLPKIIVLDDRLPELQNAIGKMQKDLFGIDKIVLVKFNQWWELSSETIPLISGIDTFLGVYPTTPPENNDPNADINVGQLIMDTYFPQEVEPEPEEEVDEQALLFELLKQREARLEMETDNVYSTGIESQ